MLVAGIVGSMYFLSCEANAPVAAPMPLAGTPQISREEIEKVLDSEDFKQLSKVMGIPIETMSQEDKKALIDETQQFAQQMEQLPPQEQEKVMQDIFSQVEQQAQQPEVQPKETVQPKVPEKKVTTPEKPKVAHHKIESSKKTAQKLASLLEKIELKFNSMLRASPDTTLEQSWAKITGELPWTISAMHRMSNNEKVLEKLSSSEFGVLNGQISSL
jgi:hypothetical protein